MQLFRNRLWNILPGMKKTLLVLFASVLFSLTVLGAAEYVTSTEHFDFIYSEETKESAMEIMAVAEDDYSRLVSFFGNDPGFHMPVYFKIDAKSYNAYYTDYTQNHIVLFVTDNPTSILSNARKPLSLTFFHELTHAFTAQIKTDFTSFMQGIFGDIFVPGDLYMNQALIEGIAVYMESRDGEGRLNDPYSLYILNQAAYEKKNLEYNDITGGRDILPGATLSYIIGASFLKDLSERYGEEKLGEFIRECYLFPLFNTTGTIFRRTFGVSIRDAWNDFMSSLTVAPAVTDAEKVTDWGYYSLLQSDGEDLFLFDQYTSSVYRLENGKLKREALSGATRSLSFSPGYRLTVYTGSTERSVIVSARHGGTCRTFDGYYSGLLLSDDTVLLFTEEDRMHRAEVRSLSDGLLLSSLNLGRDVTLGTSAVLSPSEAVVSASVCGKSGFLFFDIEKDSLSFITPEDGIVTDNVALNVDGSLSFSYVVRGENSSFAKYGIMERKGERWFYRLAEDEINGGVYYPVKDKDDVIYFITYDFDARLVRRIRASLLNFAPEAEAEVSPFVPYCPDYDEAPVSAVRYNPLKYMTRGMLLPAATASSYALGTDSGYGICYVTADPSEKHCVTFSAGWNSERKNGFGQLSYAYRDIFSTSFTTRAKDGRVDLDWNLTGTYTKYLHSTGRYVTVKDTVSLSYIENREAFANSLSVVYQDMYRMGTGRHEYLGWLCGAALENLTPSFEVGAAVPRLIPVRNGIRLNYNVPFSFSLLVKGVTNPSFGGTARFYLFNWEIQKPLSFMLVYLKNAELVFRYDGVYETADSSYSDTYTLLASLNFAPLIGRFTQAKFSVSAGVIYTREKGCRFSIGMGTL